MMKQKMIVMLCALFVTGVANAECPASLSKAEMAQCKDIESSGVSYQQWKKDHKEMAEGSTKSPITGEDVRKVAPAAGAEKSGSKMEK